MLTDAYGIHGSTVARACFDVREEFLVLPWFQRAEARLVPGVRAQGERVHL
jgi:hypothetical protein